MKGGLATHTLTTLSPLTATATGGPSTTSAAHCGHTADTRKDYRTLHQPPQVCLCDQRGDHSHLHSPLLATRTPLSYTSHSHEYIGELCTHRHRHRHTRACARTHTSCTSPPFPLPQALSKKEDNKLKEAKEFSIISFVLVLIFTISYPILVTVVVLASVFGYICDYQYGGRSSYYYYYYRPSYCAR